MGALGALLALGVVAAAHRLTEPPAPTAGVARVTVSVEAAGLHEVLPTSRGPVHVYQPPGYDPKTAGVLLYVHGYYTDLAAACRHHHLTDQFDASGRNALFIVPEAPASGAEPVVWGDLPALLEAVSRHPDFTVPEGRRVALAHSGGFRTVERWLGSGLLDTVVLLDGLYGGERALDGWLKRSGHRRRRLMLVGRETSARVERFAARYADRRELDAIPSPGELGPGGDARVVVVRSDVGHMELVTQQQAIPALLALTRLAPIAGSGPTARGRQ
ncbi:MAG: hypothetical protein JNK82_29840 [Myxococcaceae bacterium]|nr:hypothetical protein [Myxococcaceae bacterium]